ncbi:MAG: fluoride efflux transporter CrcB [Rhodococcus sp. (in: high G+C Gram-positive bacteria)]
MIGVLLAVAGALGAVLRYVVDSYVKFRFPRSALPWATIGINISGSALLGVLAGLALARDGVTDLETIVGTGFCGGYTTFGTASVETVRLAQSGNATRAASYALFTLVLSVGACAAGFAVATLV